MSHHRQNSLYAAEEPFYKNPVDSLDKLLVTSFGLALARARHRSIRSSVTSRELPSMLWRVGPYYLKDGRAKGPLYGIREDSMAPH